MGVRLYAPTLGRFLSVDPVEGGSANAYEYAKGDPVNNLDLDGKRSWWRKAWGWAKRNKWDIALTAASFIPGLGVAAWALRGARLLKGSRFIGSVSRMFAKNNIIRVGRSYAGGPYRVSIGAQRRHWLKMPQWRQRLQPFHIHMERSRGGITYNPTGRSFRVWGRWK